MRIESKVTKITAVVLCFIVWPAQASPKRDEAFKKCHDKNFLCESKCVGKSGAAYSACTDSCAAAYTKCNDDADKIPRVKSVSGVKDLPTLTQDTNAQSHVVNGKDGKSNATKKKLP